MFINTKRIASLIEGLPPTYWLIWTGTLINRLGGFVIPFLTLYLTVQRQIPVSQAALIIVRIALRLKPVTNIIGGMFSDRFGRRPVLLMSFFITPIFMVALGLANNLILISISTLLVGFFTDLYRPAIGAAIADLVPSEFRTRAYGYNYWAINLGAAIAPVLAGLIAESRYLILFLADALTTATFGFIVLFGIHETRPSEAGQVSNLRLSERMAQVKRVPTLLWFSFLTFFFGLIYMQNNVTLPLDMQSNGLGPQQYGFAIAMNGLLIIVITIPISNMAVNWPRFETVAVAASLLGLGFGFTTLASTLPFYMVSVGIWTLGEIAMTSVAPSVIADLSPPDLRGLYQGVYGAAWGLAFFFGPLAGGWVYERWGKNELWIGCLALGIVVSFGFLSLRKKVKQARWSASGPNTQL